MNWIRKRGFCLIGVFVLLLLTAGSTFAALPPHKRICVLVSEEASGWFRQNLAVGTAETLIKQELLANGYPVVNEAMVEKVKKDQRARLLEQGNPKAIRELGKIYDIRIFLVGKATLAEPLKNDFGTFTGTATVAVQAYSTGDAKYLLAETASAKELGGTPDEAAQKALETAARAIAKKLAAGGSGASQSGIPLQMRVVVEGITDFKLANEVLFACRKIPGVTEAEIESYQGGTATIRLAYRGSSKELGDALSRQGLPITVTGAAGNTVRAKAN